MMEKVISQPQYGALPQSERLLHHVGVHGCTLLTRTRGSSCVSPFTDYHNSSLNGISHQISWCLDTVAFDDLLIVFDSALTEHLSVPCMCHIYYSARTTTPPPFPAAALPPSEHWKWRQFTPYLNIFRYQVSHVLRRLLMRATHSVWCKSIVGSLQ